MDGFYRKAFALAGGASVLFIAGVLIHVATMAPLSVSHLTLTMLVAMAIAFDYENGANDAANSIATIVSTGVLTPVQAVLWAGFFNFAAFFLSTKAVALTIGKGLVDPAVVGLLVIFTILSGAVVSTHLATAMGLPISCSHALIGAMAGSAWAAAGFDAIHLEGFRKIVIFIVLAPMIGMFLAIGIGAVTTWICRRKRPGAVDSTFRGLQLLSAALYSLGHGSNDAQKTMGVIALLLYSTVWKDQAAAGIEIPWWVAAVCYTAMALGTMAGGWKVVQTTGIRLTKLRPFGGFCAELAAACTLFTTARFGIPVSTTHTIVGAIVGIGSLHRLSAVRWGLAIHIVWAWVLTIPFSFGISALCYYVASGIRSLLM